MRKTLKKALLLGAIPVLLTGCNASGPDSKTQDKVNLFYAYSHENLLSNLNYWGKEEYSKRGYTLNFNCLRGEHDGVQLVMNAYKHVADFDFKIKTSLKDKAGNTIPDSAISVYVEWYTYLDVTNERDAYTGYYPDALVPIENYKMREKNFINQGKNQALYIDLNTPTDAIPGSYTGEAVLTIDGAESIIPLTATIHKDLMPRENHFRSSFLIWYDQISIGEKENHSDEMDQKYYDFVLDKRLTPQSLAPKYEASPTIFAEKMIEIAKDERVTGYRMPIQNIHDSTFETRTTNYMNALVEKNIQLRKAGDNVDLFDKLYFYADDEPNVNDYERVRRHDKIIYEAKKAAAKRLVEYPDLQKSVMGIENIVTTPLNSTLLATEETGGVQTWCPQFDNFNTEEKRAEYRERQLSNDREGGENVWWYGCISPKGVFPGYHLNSDTIYSRIIPYMQFDYGIEGELYWNVCFYSKYANGVTFSRNIWYDGITWENCAGDGALLYPGYEFNVNGPISTLRMENILAGNEEYEYLYLLNNYVEQYNAKHQTNKDLNQILTKEYATLFKGVKPIHENGNVEVTRNHLLEALDEFNSSLEDGMTYLEKLGK